MGLTHRAHLTAHALLPSVPMLAEQASALEHRHMLLHCGEAHRVTTGQVGHGVLVLQDKGNDIPAGGVGERVEDLVSTVAVHQFYNHKVVC